jgi:hypothetical protein
LEDNPAHSLCRIRAPGAARGDADELPVTNFVGRPGRVLGKGSLVSQSSLPVFFTGTFFTETPREF